MCSHADIKTKCRETDFKLRTPTIHNQHVAAVSIDDTLVSAYGVAKSCAFDMIQGFSPVTAFPPDIMHDCLEGVLSSVMQAIFKHFQDSGICLIGFVNERLRKFKFGRCENKNKPRALPGNIIMQNGKISLSASETLCLFRYLPFIIGDLVPYGNKAWHLYCLLSEVMDIILAPITSTNISDHLRCLIEEFYFLFAAFAPDLVKPKLHFLLHYPRLLEIYGPLRNLWCMRFESFHRKLKLVAQRCKNFKNVCKTVASRIQLMKCYEQCDIAGLTGDVESVIGKPILVDELPHAFSIYLQTELGFQSYETAISVKCITENGVTYSLNDVFVLDVLDDVPMFIQIKTIVVLKSKTYICGSFLKTLDFISHYHSYAVIETGTMLFFKPGMELCGHPHDLYKCVDKQMVRLQYRIFL